MTKEEQHGNVKNILIGLAVLLGIGVIVGLDLWVIESFSGLGERIFLCSLIDLWALGSAVSRYKDSKKEKANGD